MREIPRLTDLELMIMSVLWEQNASITIQDIASYLVENKISVASITQSIKHLVKKRAVEVDEHVLVSNVYARTFTPLFTREEFLAVEFSRLQKGVFRGKKTDACSFISAFLSIDKDEFTDLDEINEIQKIIDSKKGQLKKESE